MKGPKDAKNTPSVATEISNSRRTLRRMYFCSGAGSAGTQ
jgi:hypothetical protein